MFARLLALLESPRMPIACALLAMALCLPIVGAGLQTDDHLMVEALEGDEPLFESFRITPERFRHGQARGDFVWWSGPEVSVAFLRPIAELSHRADVLLWGDLAWPMYLENVLLYGLLVWLAGLIFRTLLPASLDGRRAAGLAALMFALNDAHASTVGWISGRNTLLATVFGLASFLSYLRAREGGRRWPSPLLLALALLSAEAGVATLAYFAAHALVIAQGPARDRLRPLRGHAVVALAWASLYALGGYGAHGTTWYRDLAGDPLGTLRSGLLDLPAWLFSQLGLSMVTPLLAAPPWAAWIPALLLLPILALLWPVVRADRVARFFALALVLAIVPLFTTVVQDRVLLGAGLGGFGLLGCALAALRAGAPTTLSRGRRISLRALAVLHLVLSPLLLVPALMSLGRIENATQRIVEVLPERAGRDVFLVNAPMQLLSLYAQAVQRRAGRPLPASLHQLHAGSASLSVTRVDARTLEVRAHPGWGTFPIERVFTSPDWSPRIGEARNFGALEVTVSETDDRARPSLVRFHLAEPLESARYAWLRWQDGRPTRWTPPAIGERVELRALRLPDDLPR